jgi:uroporphyrinogen decarboxylase
MNSLERVIDALGRRVPDRVPTFEWIIADTVIEGICGKGCALEDFIDRMDLDAIVVSPNNKNTIVGDRHFIDEWGIEKKSIHADPLPLAVKGPIGSKKDLKTYNPPDPFAPYRMDNLRRAVKRFKGKRAIVFQVRDVFSYPRDLLGFENLLMSLIDDPALVGDLVEMSVDYNSKLAVRAIAEGADVIFSGDDVADNRGPFFNPAVYKEIFLPGFKRLVGKVKENGAYYIKHTDGNVLPLVGYFIEAGIDCLDPIERPAGMDIGEMKKRYGDRLALKGNIDCRHTLTTGTIREVTEEVKSCIRRASPGGGYILSSSNSIHSGVNPKNYQTMIRALREYGTYPINIDS